MVQSFARRSARSRLIFGGLLAVWLNLALLPCAMAIEAETEHDCCPPSIDLQPADCCQTDDLCADSRSEIDSPDDTAYFSGESVHINPTLNGAGKDESPPRGPPVPSRPIHLTNCVFLK